MEYYDALIQILSEVFGLPVGLSTDGHSTPKAGEVLLVKLHRTSDTQAQKQVFSGKVAALVQEIDLLERTQHLTGLGFWQRTADRVHNYETLAFSGLEVPDIKAPEIQQIL